MSNTKKRTTEHQEIINALRTKQRAKKRRFNFLLYGSFGLVLAAIITAVAVAVSSSIQERNEAAEAAKRPISDVQTFTGLTRNHVQEAVDYPQQPGAGGDHSPVWTNCGVYSEPVNEQRAVHSLEHGAVWITYRADLPADELDTLAELAKGKPYVLLSPVQDQVSPVTATAWGAQLTLQEAADERIATFIRAYAQSSEAPEPGAPCTGGTNG